MRTRFASISPERGVYHTYQDRHGTATTRPFDPYAVGYCHLRQDIGVFRLDRITAVEPEGTSFTRPADLDYLGYVRRSIALLPSDWSVEIALDASLAEAQRWIAPLFTELTECDGTVLMRCTVEDLDWLARLLAGLPFDFQVRTPPALGHALDRIRDRLARATAS